MSGFNEAEAKRSVRATRKDAHRDQQPGAAAKVLQLVVTLV